LLSTGSSAPREFCWLTRHSKCGGATRAGTVSAAPIFVTATEQGRIEHTLKVPPLSLLAVLPIFFVLGLLLSFTVRCCRCCRSCRRHRRKGRLLIARAAPWPD